MNTDTIVAAFLDYFTREDIDNKILELLRQMGEPSAVKLHLATMAIRALYNDGVRSPKLMGHECTCRFDNVPEEAVERVMTHFGMASNYVPSHILMREYLQAQLRLLQLERALESVEGSPIKEPLRSSFRRYQFPRPVQGEGSSLCIDDWGVGAAQRIAKIPADALVDWADVSLFRCEE